MNNVEMEDGEWLSALADGQLQGDDFARAMATIASSDEARSIWHAYHVAGDVLRCADLADCRSDRTFVTRLRSRLAMNEEPMRVAVVGGSTPTQRPPEYVAGVVAGASANDAVVRWKWLAAAASMAAVATMGWHLSQIGSGGSAQLASSVVGPGVVAATADQSSAQEQPRMLRDPRLDELLAAHRQLGGSSALQMPAGFLRNATFEQSTR